MEDLFNLRRTRGRGDADFQLQQLEARLRRSQCFIATLPRLIGDPDGAVLLDFLGDYLGALLAGGAYNFTLAYSVATNALTIAAKQIGATDATSDQPIFAVVRSSTAGSGDVAVGAIAAAHSLVVSSGSTLGHSNSDGRWVYVYLVNSSGTTLKLAVSSKFYGLQGIVTTVAEGGSGAADSATAMYSDAIYTSKPFLCVSRFQAPQTAAGTWAAAPTAAEAWPFLPPVAEDYVYIREEETSATEGGTFTSGAWRTRVLNTEVADTGNNAAVASNQITLNAGTYRFRASAPGLYCDGHQAKLKNITDTIEYMGTSEMSASSSTFIVAPTRSVVRGRFTIAAAKVFELQHQCGTTRSSNGLGKAASLGTEVYAEVEFWKES